MEDKPNVKRIIFIVASIVLVCVGVLFFGRCTGKNEFRATINNLQDALTDGLEREQELTRGIEKERELVAEMAGNFSDIRDSITTVQGLWEHISVRIDELDAALTAQREIADILADLDRRAGVSAISVETGLNEGIRLLDTAIDRVQKDSD